MTADSVQQLLEQLDLTQVDEHVYIAPTHRYPDAERFPMLFGGLIAAQTLRAAQLTVDPVLRAHSLHGHFLLSGEPGKDVRLEVDPIRDGRSFGTRRVVAVQDEGPIFAMTASFHRREPGPDRQPVFAGTLPEPSGEPHRFAMFTPSHVFEIREESSGWGTRYWARTAGALPDDPALHECAVAYLSDLGVLPATADMVGAMPGETAFASSLDHTLHLHRPMRADDWMIVAFSPVTMAGSRGLMHTTIHSADGVHGASVTQEGLVRVRE